MFALRSLAAAGFVLASLAASAAAAPPARIVSLVPSLTEDLFAIGAGARVVAVSAFTDFPPEAARLPRVSALYSSLDSERVLRLRPDVVVGIRAQAPLVADLARAGVRTELVGDDSFDDIFGDIADMGRITGRAAQAAALERTLHARTKNLVGRISRAAGRSRPSVFVVLGTAPIYTVGRASYIATLIRFAGGRNAADDLATPYGRYGEESLLALQPDVLVTDRETSLGAVLDRPPWNALRAVREKRVYVLDDPDLLERPGPRYNEGLIWLAARLHPGVALR